MKKQFKKLPSVWLIILGVLVLVILGFVFLFTYSVSGQVSNLATGQPIDGIQLQLNSHSSKTDKNGHFNLKGIKIYESKNLVVQSSDKYESIEPIKINFSLGNRNIEKNIKLEPTLAEMVRISNVASMNGQYDYLWDLMHPDDKAYWVSKEEYSALLKERNDLMAKTNISVKSLEMGENARQLAAWKDPITGKDYKDVMEVPIKGVMVYFGQEQPESTLNYYQRIDGFYHYFTTVNKDDLKATIEKLKNS